MVCWQAGVTWSRSVVSSWPAVDIAMLPSNSAAAPRSMSEKGGGIREALLRSVATWFCSAALACAVSCGFSSISVRLCAMSFRLAMTESIGRRVLSPSTTA